MVGSFLFALVDESDRHHDLVLTVAQTIGKPLLVPSVLLPEICYLISTTKTFIKGTEDPCF
jgi:hypothetical protein